VLGFEDDGGLWMRGQRLRGKGFVIAHQGGKYESNNRWGAHQRLERHS
jgi:hypothetical protein